VVAAGYPLVILDDPKKIVLMQERFKSFGAYVRGAGRGGLHER